MKLYECPRNVQVILKDGNNEIINFHHIDGMYSYCTNQKGETVHLAAWTEVEIVK